MWCSRETESPDWVERIYIRHCSKCVNTLVRYKGCFGPSHRWHYPRIPCAVLVSQYPMRAHCEKRRLPAFLKERVVRAYCRVLIQELERYVCKRWTITDDNAGLAQVFIVQVLGGQCRNLFAILYHYSDIQRYRSFGEASLHRAVQPRLP